MLKENEVFLVVGGNSGIGKSVVKTLSSNGYRVIICDKSISEDLSSMFQTYVLDLRDRQSVFEFSKIISKHHINNMIYAAGAQEEVDILDLNTSQWDELYHIHVLSAFILSQAVSRNIIELKNGIIVFISSIHGDIIREIANYSSTKAAQNMMMKEFACRLAPFGGRAFSVAPGSVDTPLLRKSLNNQEMINSATKSIPMRRHGTSDEIASAVLKLMQIEYLTGTVVAIDGGLSLVI